MGLLVLLVVAGICGAVGRSFAGGSGSFLVSIAIGFVGALLGTLVAQFFRLPGVLVVSIDGHPFPILWSIIGSAGLVGLIHLLSRGVARRPWG